MKDSFLMCDSTEGDGKAEVVMDYVMSFSLRHAVDKYLIEKPMLCRYCRYMLGVLLDGLSITDETKIESIEVWKEWQYMDLVVEAIVDNQKYALLIENKYYSKLRENQLVDYKRKFDEYYDNKDVYVSKENRRYKLVTCHDEDKIEQFYGSEVKKTKESNKEDFKILTFYDLLPNEDVYEDTESEIFNEFWLRKW